MAAMEVLRPQHVLHGPHTAAHHRRRCFVEERKKKQNSGQNRRIPRSDKKESVDSKKSKDRLVNGEVILLKRGDPLDLFTTSSSSSKIKGGDSNQSSPKSPKPKRLAVSSTGRIGPKSPPEMLPKPMPLATSNYAGFGVSPPSPRSVPLPSFFNKKHEEKENNTTLDFDSQNLKRILRLE